MLTNFRSFWEQAWDLFGRTVCKVLRKCKTAEISGKVKTQDFYSFWEQAWDLFGRNVCKVLRKCKEAEISGKVRTQDFYVETSLTQLR